MSNLTSLTLVDGTCEVTMTGTPITLVKDGVQISSGAHYIVSSDADYATRRQVTVKTRPAVVDKSGAYTKDKKSVSIVSPFLDESTGKISYTTVRIELEAHPGVSSANLLYLRNIGIQILDGATDLWNFGEV